MLFIDSDNLSYHLRGNQQVSSRISELQKKGEELAVTSINVYEIKRGFRSKSYPKLEKIFENLLSVTKVFPLDDKAILIAADIYGCLKNKGALIADDDIFIAAIVIRNNGTLFTNNIEHFSRIQNLKLLLP